MDTLQKSSTVTSYDLALEAGKGLKFPLIEGKGTQRHMVNTSSPITVAEVREARDMWIRAVQSRSLEATVALYDASENNSARLNFDTEEDINSNGKAALEAYFRDFLSKDEIIANFPDVTEDSVFCLGLNQVIYSGYYTIYFTKDGLTAQAKDKFSYVYVRKPGVPHLLITAHNSGQKTRHYKWRPKHPSSMPQALPRQLHDCLTAMPIHSSLSSLQDEEAPPPVTVIGNDSGTATMTLPLSASNTMKRGVAGTHS